MKVKLDINLPERTHREIIKLAHKKKLKKEQIIEKLLIEVCKPDDLTGKIEILD